MFVNVEVAQATNPVSGEEVYFFHEDHIGRPAQVSEIQDYDSDGSLLQTNHYYDVGGPGTIWQAQYSPFGTVDDDHNSLGIEIGNPGTTGIVWEVPFRFPGQYEDPELTGLMFYNHYRFYIPSIGRYNQADRLFTVMLSTGPYSSNKTITSFLLKYFVYYPDVFFSYTYVSSSPLMYIDRTGENKVLDKIFEDCIKDALGQRCNIACNEKLDICHAVCLTLKKNELKCRKIIGDARLDCPNENECSDTCPDPGVASNIH